jgi:hypothetical protein
MSIRTFGTPEHPSAPVPPDTVYSLVMTGGSSAQALGWISSAGSAVANAAAAGAGIARITAITSAGTDTLMCINLYTTAANVISSGSSYGSSGISHPVVGKDNLFQIPGGSTGFSVASITSGYFFLEQWRK